LIPELIVVLLWEKPSLAGQARRSSWPVVLCLTLRGGAGGAGFSMKKTIVQDFWAGSLQRRSKGRTAMPWDSPQTVKNCFRLLMN
jgi:hypothetical protein